MITWSSFPLFALLSLMLWLAGALSALMRSAGGRRLALWLTAAGVVVYVVFVGGLWHSLQRPPLRTLGETRLWYTLFMMLSGLVVYARWRYRWILLCSLLVGTVFMCINVLSPDTHDRSLMPALQSAWFVPHVTVYMFSYSIFGCAFLLSVAGLWQRTGRFLPSTDRLMLTGYCFLTAGMLSGCIWAKQAWGNFWTWDAKETWAAACWCACLVYVHLRRAALQHPATATHDKAYVHPYAWVIIAFALLQMCWYGVSFLPSAAASMHNYAY